MIPSPDELAADLARLPVDRARVKLHEILDAPWGKGFGDEFARGLQFNALLVTRLRERGVRIWGTEPT